jgi:hypothetical protein
MSFVPNFWIFFDEIAEQPSMHSGEFRLTTFTPFPLAIRMPPSEIFRFADDEFVPILILSESNPETVPARRDASSP